MIGLHCDRDGCDTWIRSTGTPIMWTLSDPAGDTHFHFCTLDCLTFWAAASSEPTLTL